MSFVGAAHSGHRQRRGYLPTLTWICLQDAAADRPMTGVETTWSGIASGGFLNVTIFERFLPVGNEPMKFSCEVGSVGVSADVIVGVARPFCYYCPESVVRADPRKLGEVVTL